MQPCYCKGSTIRHIYIDYYYSLQRQVVDSYTSPDHSAPARMWIFWCLTVHDSYFDNYFIYFKVHV